MNEHLTIYSSILGILGFVNIFYIARLSRIEKKQDSDEVRLNGIEKNYLDRFADLGDKVHNSKIEILQAINDFNETIYYLKLEVNTIKAKNEK